MRKNIVHSECTWSVSLIQIFSSALLPSKKIDPRIFVSQLQLPLFLPRPTYFLTILSFLLSSSSLIFLRTPLQPLLLSFKLFTPPLFLPSPASHYLIHCSSRHPLKLQPPPWRGGHVQGYASHAWSFMEVGPTLVQGATSSSGWSENIPLMLLIKAIKKLATLGLKKGSTNIYIYIYINQI